MSFLKNYFKIINYSLLGIIFSFSSFYLILNIFHFLEVSREYQSDFKNNSLVLAIDDTLSKIVSNTNKSTSSYNTYFKDCLNSFNNDTYNSLKTKSSIKSKDVYKLVESYDNEIVNKCFNKSMYFVINSDLDTVKDKLDLIKLNINSIYSDTYYLKKDLLNNSSYSFTTVVNFKDSVKDSFDEVMNSYNKAANLLLYLSNLVEVGADND